jgi:hypothetical protein
MSKHCSICAKAGYPEEVYTSHFIRETRDPASKVTCPVLKFNICGKCGKAGHFTSSCRVVFRAPKPKVEITKPKIQTKNTYDFGDSDSETEEPTPEEVPFISKKDTNDMFALNAWQKEFEALLAKPEDERNTSKAYWDATHKMFCLNGYVILAKQVRTSMVVETIHVIKPVKSSWADDSDED